MRRIAAWTAFAVLTIGALVAGYQMLFALWMTAYPYSATTEWRSRFYVRLGITLALALLWGAVIVWILRRRRSGPT
jgi:hypothetical protein